MLNSTLAIFSSRKFNRFGSSLGFMVKNFKHRRFVLFIAASLVVVTGFAQDKNKAKIDHIFQAIIAQKDVPDNMKKIPTAFMILPTEGRVDGKSTPEKRYDCVIYTKNGRGLRDSGILVNAILPTFVTAWVTVEQIEKLASMNDVSFIEAPSMLNLHNDIAVASSGASLLQAGRLNNTVYKGKGVIVAIFDTGIDWDHPDFRDPIDQTKSRILRIWDQTLTAIAGEAPPAGFSGGVEYTQAQINDELDGTPTGIVRERDTNGHGTHVAGTAAGNGAALASKKYAGMAPEADIVVVRGSATGSFSSTNEINALTYFQNVATAFGKPIVVNMSLGSIFGPHDGTTSQEVAVDNFTASAAGRAVVISAGNDNGTNLHNRFTLPASGSNSVSFTVPSGTTGTDVFEYRLYANNGNSFNATLTVPGGATVTALPGNTTTTNVLGANFTVSVSNFLDAGNLNRFIDVYVQRNGVNSGNPVGTWTLTLDNNTAAALTIDGWLYYRNTVFANTAIVGGDNEFLVGSPGNATSAITAAAHVEKLRWFSNSTTAPGGYAYTAGHSDSIATFSSHGPRRDGVQKPDLSADGQAMISCLSSDAGGVTPPTSSSVVIQNLYFVEQGTSMSAPTIAGATALLLQQKPTATASELKGLLTGSANKDAFTELASVGATPNAVYGYGKLDVFKAASTLFGCTPPLRRTYQYDNLPTTSSTVTSFGVTTTRIAVRMTPDATGRIGGIYFHTGFQSRANLTFEIRANNAGIPGGLFATINMDSTNENITKFAWNYLDISSLNLSATSGVDFFVVVYRNLTNTNGWSLCGESQFLDNRSEISNDNGATWGLFSSDFLIRSVVYANGQTTGTIAAANSQDARNISTSNQFINTFCELIAQLVPNGSSPVTGSVLGRVWVDGAVPTFNSVPFVQRHYQIQPAAGAPTATGRVTLYFKQSEFTAFNAHPGSALDLPVDAADVANNKANLLVIKYPGTSSDNSGQPGTYSGPGVIINPADNDIVWNAAFNRWEVTFDVVGFSGFIVTTNSAVLPIAIEYFRGNRNGTSNVLNWKVNCDNESAQFDIERSANGTDFTSIGTVATTVNRCQQPFDYTDATPLTGKNFYRLKIIGNTGQVRYSSVILLQTDRTLTTTVYPTVVPKGASIQVNFAANKGSIYINDAGGKLVYTHSLLNGVQSFTPSLPSSGIYFYTIKDDTGANVTSGRLLRN